MSATPNPRTWLLIFDPTLRSNDGHSRNYDYAVAEAARGVFDRVVIFADPAFTEPPPARVVLRVISESPLMSALRATVRRAAPRTNSAALPNAPAGPLLVPFQRVWMGLRARGLAYSLARALREAGCNQGDQVHIFVQQADLYEIAAVDAFRARYGGSAWARVTFHLLMRHDPEITRAGQEDLPAFRARLLRLSRAESPRIFFHTDSAAIADGFQGLTEYQVPWNVVPIPVSRKASVARLRKTEGPQNLVRIRMLGSSRMERGFGTLRALIPSFPGYFSECRVCFAVQVDRRSADPVVGRTIRWLDAYARRHSTAMPELELLNGPADDDIYFSWMAATDILVAPYTSIKYRQSTSGVFVEALHLGIPSIVMQGTWAARIVADAADRGLQIGEIAATVDTIPQVAHRLWSAHSRYRSDLEIFRVHRKSEYGSGIAELLLHADSAATSQAGGEHSST
jgi:glycosyltransferase involved in cell wall biosynthesis